MTKAAIDIAKTLARLGADAFARALKRESIRTFQVIAETGNTGSYQ
jgi:hypothetical protein